MNWSKHNLIYESKKHGHLLFNFLSGAFIDLNDYELRNKLLAINKGGSIPNDQKLVDFLLSSAIINTEGDEANIRFLKMNALKNRFSHSEPVLTIIPTMDCNLRCNYCFIGSNIQPVSMTNDVAAQLKKHIQENYGNVQKLKVHWFGGEPLLEYARIKEISAFLDELNINYEASIVTNGCLLNSEIIADFERLHINNMQITLDGLRGTHDQKRIYKDGKGTFDLIMNNLNHLHERVRENAKIRIDIRINVDKTNMHEYHQMHDQINTQFPAFVVYPGILMQYKSCTSAINCFGNHAEVAEFLIEQYEKYGIDDIQFYPFIKGVGSCVAENPYNNMVGPEGELYLCLKDVGDKKESIGDIFSGKRKINVQTAYTTEFFAYDMDQCSKCRVLPLCGGGCPNLRYRNEKYGEQHDCCAQFKNNNILKRYLDIHYEIVKKYE